MAKSLWATQQSSPFVPFYIFFFGISLVSVQVVARVVEVSMFKIALKGHTYGVIITAQQSPKSGEPKVRRFVGNGYSGNLPGP
jgi:hypothetical protein